MTTIAPELNLPSDHPLRQILDTIAAHPEVREPVLRVLLTEAFLALPARMDALTEQVQGLREEFDGFRQETREQFRSVHERIDETNRDLGERIDETNRDLGERIDETNRALGERIDETNRALGERIDETNRDLGERIDETNRALGERIDETNRVLGERIDESSRDVINQMNGSIGRLRGETYERKCAEKIDTILVDHFLYAVEYDRTAIVDRLVQARHDRLISRAEYQDARNVDIVAQEKAGYDEDQHLAVVEVSITFNREDLETAARRAAIVGRVFGLRTDAFVATNGPWPDEVNEVARPLGVTIIRYFLPEFAAL
jgi:hypothetical protein